MKLSLQNIKLQDSHSELNDQAVNIEIAQGKVSKITPYTGENKTADFDGKSQVCASTGWFDPSVVCGEPYSEERGTFADLTHSALLGGFTDVGIVSRPNFIINSQEKIQLIKQHSSQTEFHAIASLSQQMDGVAMNEFRILEQQGALGYADVHTSPCYNMLKNSAEYLTHSSLPIVVYPQDYTMIGTGQMNEGYYSTLYGMAGINKVSEQIAISSLGELSEYTKKPIHLAHISSAESLAILQRYPLLSAQISVGLLHFIDRDLEDYDTRKKSMPPFRSKQDRDALIQAIQNGQISEVVSDHTPWNIEEKDKEFDYAQFGLMSLEVVYSILNEVLGKSMSQADIVALISTNTRKRFNLNGGITEGNQAKITLFDPTASWTLSEKDLTETKNSPWIGKTLKGKAIGTINGNAGLKLADA